MTTKSVLAGMLSTLMTVSAGWAATGRADVHGTAASSAISGTVLFEDTAAGLKVSAQLSHLPPGQHAFHIHEFGSCDDSAKAAGAHYNPMGAPHGQVLKVGMQHAHAGDLGNITADASGNASMNAVIPGLTLAEGPHTVGGRAVIVHEKVDDFSQPAGNAGSRIGCGAIVLTSSPAAPK